MLNEFSQSVLLIVAGLFPVINPPVSGFIIMSLVPNATAAQMNSLAWRISINGFIILATSLSIGAYVLTFFGISIPVLRVAGGLVIGFTGWKLLQSSGIEEKTSQSMSTGTVVSTTYDSLAFYPMTLPITVGPGSIAVAVSLGTGSPKDGLTTMHVFGAAVAVLILCASIFLCIKYARNVVNLLGKTGAEVTMRLFAFILFCIGIQIFWFGMSELIENLKFK